MTKPKDKTVFFLSVFVLCYFVFFIAAYEYHIDNVALGVIREILTIPLLIGLVVLFAIALASFRKLQFRLNSYPFFSLLVLIVTAVVLVTFS